MDALSFYECGRHDVVSVPNGANANLDYLDDYIEEYFDDKETIFIASDTDTKGVILRDELIRRFGAERCRVLEYGEGCKDANEHLMKYGSDSLLKCLANAPEIKLEGIFTVSDFEQSLDALFEYGMQKGVTIGHDNFDRLLSFETKRLCVVTGIPGSGKSEFIDEIAERLNMRYGWRFAYFSPENAPLAYHASN
jgi:twinkle protein